MYDVVIAGAGPAGLGAAIYAARADLNAVVLEEMFAGGQVLTTYEVDNYPACPHIGGQELAQNMKAHAVELGAEIREASVSKIVDAGDHKIVRTSAGDYETRCVILACGAKHATLDVPGEAEFSGMGVSYCATCDGAFFRNAQVAVVGGGDVAAEDAIYLSKICSKVFLIHRREALRAAASLQEEMKGIPNIEVIFNSVVKEIGGALNGGVTGVTVYDKVTQEDTQLNVKGVFIAVGMRPRTENYRGLLSLDEAGYIIAGEDCKTNIPGIFAAGDIRTKRLRQIVTAAADGANAIASVQEYLRALTESRAGNS